MVYKLIIIASLLSALACGGATTTAEPPPPPTDADVEWLVGDWLRTDGGGSEHWRSQGDNLIGIALTQKDGDLSFFEVLRIGASEGGPALVVFPGGRARVEFALARETGDIT